MKTHKPLSPDALKSGFAETGSRQSLCQTTVILTPSTTERPDMATMVNTPNPITVGQLVAVCNCYLMAFDTMNASDRDITDIDNHCTDLALEIDRNIWNMVQDNLLAQCSISDKNGTREWNDIDHVALSKLIIALARHFSTRGA